MPSAYRSPREIAVDDDYGRRMPEPPVRHCPGLGLGTPCGVKLSRYNRGALCYVCERYQRLFGRAGDLPVGRW